MSQEAIKPVINVSTGTTTSKVAPVEAPIIEVASPPKEAADPRLDQLAKRERAFRAQQRQFQQQQQAFKAEQEKLKTAAPDTSWKDRVKSNFLDVAAEAGLSHEQIAQQLMNHTPESVEIKQLRAEMAAIKSKMQTDFDKLNETNGKAYQQALKQVSRDVQVTLNANAPEYELINANGKVGLDAVVAYIDSTYKEDEIFLTADEAAKEVEEFLLEEAITLAKLKKVQAKLTPPEEKKPDTKTLQQKTPTLTQQASSSTPTRSTSAQRRERAILAMQGLLNK